MTSRTARKLLQLAVVSATLASACAEVADTSSGPPEATSAAVDVGERNSIKLTALSLPEFNGKTIHFVAGDAHASQTVAHGSAVVTLDGAVPAGTFGQFVYAYFSAEKSSTACSDVGPVLSAFVSTEGRSGSLIPLTIQQDAFNQLDCKRLARVVPGLELARDTHPNVHDALVHATGLSAHDGKRMVFVVRNALGTSINTAIIHEGEAKATVKDAIDGRTFGGFVSAYIHEDGQSGQCEPGDPVFQTFASYRGANPILVPMNVGANDGVTHETDCSAPTDSMTSQDVGDAEDGEANSDNDDPESLALDEAAQRELDNWGEVEEDMDEAPTFGDDFLRSVTNDGRAVIRFRNRCDFPVVIGRAADAHGFLTIKSGHKADRFVGRDSQTINGLAFSAVRKGRDPGAGNRTLAEFTLNTTNEWLHRGDSIDVSLVDGFTLPMAIHPVGHDHCPEAECLKNLLPHCPRNNQIKRNGHIISCTKHGDKDNPQNPAAVYFERECKHAYSWSKDDRATKGCHAQDYIVTICG